MRLLVPKRSFASALKVKLPLERNVRLAAGITLFGYAACHFVSHATGLFRLAGIQAIGHDIILAPWRTPFGLLLLLTAFLVHLGLGLRALWRRRHLKMPAIEAWQLGLGLTIPLLLAPHVVDARIGVLLYGLEDSYLRVLFLFWVTDPAINLTRQFVLMFVVWTHGCIGLHMWLRFRGWYQRHIRSIASVAFLLPALATLGVVNAGWDTILHAAVAPGFAAAHGPPPTASPFAAIGPKLALWAVGLQALYLAILASVIAVRFARNWREKKILAFSVEYRDGRKVRAPLGYSLLEASRSAGIAHVSVCGGRGRCSTCRIGIWSGAEYLPAPDEAESATLRRVGAPDGVRLACQLRPTANVGVTLLAKPGRPLDGLSLSLDEGREIVVTAFFIDVRDSTRLAAGRLPFDAIFILNRYIQATTAVILGHGGHITSIAGDGVMAVFGLNGDARAGARSALTAADAVWRAIDEVNADLVSEIASPLRFGIGVHTGMSIVGAVGPLDRTSLQLLGDTGNVAARLESLTKEKECIVIVSAATLAAAEWADESFRFAQLDIRGRDAISAVLIRNRDDLRLPTRA